MGLFGAAHNYGAYIWEGGGGGRCLQIMNRQWLDASNPVVARDSRSEQFQFLPGYYQTGEHKIPVLP